MADIFLSYASEDRKRVVRLAKALEGLGWSVFWDLTVPAGASWDDHIGGELDEARCVVVVWSQAAVESKWVREEAREGREKETLVPAFFAKVRPPFGFRGIQGPDLTAWRSSTEAPAFRALVEGIERILGTAPSRTEVERRPASARKPAAKKRASAKIPATRKKAVAKKREPKRELKEGGRPPEEAEAGYLWTAPVLGMRFRYIPPGTFWMGSPETEADRYLDEQRHQVTLTRGFWMGETPVTQGQWRQLMSNDPSEFSQCGDECPVESVSWFDAVAFANRLSEPSHFEGCYEIRGSLGTPGMEGFDAAVALKEPYRRGFRLPTEAEWEYACRAGTKTRFWSGDLESDLLRVAWCQPNSFSKTRPVGAMAANPWGLHDAHGNVYEWVNDWYDGGYPQVKVSDPMGAASGRYRVIRGGGWNISEADARSANRTERWANGRFAHVGFRVLLPGPEPDGS